MIAAHAIYAVGSLAGVSSKLVFHAASPWASITYAGTRHRVAMLFGNEAAATAFMAALPEHEFDLPGHIVADAAISEVTADNGAWLIVADILVIVAD